jgi:hypothetical protein
MEESKEKGMKREEQVKVDEEREKGRWQKEKEDGGEKQDELKNKVLFLCYLWNKQVFCLPVMVRLLQPHQDYTEPVQCKFSAMCDGN